MDVKDDLDADKANKLSANRALGARIPMCRFVRVFSLRSLPSAYLTTALLAEIQSRSISIDAG